MKRVLLIVLLSLGACAAEPPIAPRAEALHWTVETAEGRFLGSATALGDGRLLTNRHVVGALETVTVARDGQRHTVQRIRRAPGMDAALLEVGSAMIPATELGPLPGRGDTLAVAGARSGRRQSGFGVAEALRPGSGFAEARLPAAPGYSGGPIIDAEGRLVGIVAAAVEPNAAAARALSDGGTDRMTTPRHVLYLPIAQVLQAVGVRP